MRRNGNLFFRRRRVGVVPRLTLSGPEDTVEYRSYDVDSCGYVEYVPPACAAGLQITTEANPDHNSKPQKKKLILRNITIEVINDF